MRGLEVSGKVCFLVQKGRFDPLVSVIQDAVKVEHVLVLCVLVAVAVLFAIIHAHGFVLRVPLETRRIVVVHGGVVHIIQSPVSLEDDPALLCKALVGVSLIAHRVIGIKDVEREDGKIIRRRSVGSLDVLVEILVHSSHAQLVDAVLFGVVFDAVVIDTFGSIGKINLVVGILDESEGGVGSRVHPVFVNPASLIQKLGILSVQEIESEKAFDFGLVEINFRCGSRCLGSSWIDSSDHIFWRHGISACSRNARCHCQQDCRPGVFGGLGVLGL
mmetsp:Transcript_13716/g.28292  ORF Transcript_13716/g.28292 Transcript_13716/m.28292 type:complete len:274 (-) Transcript_13716:72-893(-)